MVATKKDEACKSLLGILILKPPFPSYQAGVQVADPVEQVFNGQEVEVWPRITWKPKWGLTFSEIKSRVSGNCSISQRSTLVIKGKNVHLKDLSLDGTLIVNAAAEDAEVCKEQLLLNSKF